MLVCVGKHGLLHGSSDDLLYLSVSLKGLSLFLINKYVGINVVDVIPSANLLYRHPSRSRQSPLATLTRNSVNRRKTVSIVALTFLRRYKCSDWRFCACAIIVNSSMCSERTKHLWYKYYGLFVLMSVTSRQSYLSQINTRQTSFEACFQSKRKSRDYSAP